MGGEIEFQPGDVHQQLGAVRYRCRRAQVPNGLHHYRHGIITIDGDADFTGGTLNFEVDGLTPGTQHDQIVVTGNATLGGTIVVTYGFSPLDNDTFDLITCGGACSGAFTTETLPADSSLANLGAIVRLTFSSCAGTICWDDGGADGLWLTATN